jgi:uncharacterized protein YbjQ (UPF0145 family)
MNLIITKRFWAIFFIFNLFACSNKITKFPSRTEYYMLDFSKHENDGFFITTEPPIEKYTSVGLILVEMDQGAERSEEVKKYRSGVVVREINWLKDSINGQMALDSLVVLAKSYGADAIVNFKSNITHSYKAASVSETVGLISISASGFAIKRDLK